MLFMKEQRAKVVAECTLKESAAINQILGRRVSVKHSCHLGGIHPVEEVFDKYDLFCKFV